MNITWSPSPNFDERPKPVAMIVLHYTGMETGKAALERLCDAQAKVSAHYLVEEDGRIFQMVKEEDRAWHAGVSYWQGQEGVNDTSVGIEIVNPGHEWGYRVFPDAQIEAVIELVKAIKSRWNVPLSRIIGHSDIAPERKEDPGELFPWTLLASLGLAIAPMTREITECEADDYFTCLDKLREIGYRVEGNFHAAPVLAFQRRFIPLELGQGLNQRTRKAINCVHQQFSAEK